VQKLVDYFTPLADRLPEVDRMRLRKNPLRILDSKEEITQPLLEQAPHIIDYLCAECADHFARLRSYLDALERPYVLDYRIVRGLDYYTKTVFEIKAEGLGAQDTVIGGGRYDGLVEELGGRPTPSIGFGCGVERMVLAMQQMGLPVPEEPRPDVLVAYLGEAAKVAAVQLVEKLHDAEVAAVLAFGDRSLKSQLKSADRAGASLTIILGEEELKAGMATVRDMSSSQQVSISLDALVDWVQTRRVAGVTGQPK
jgi:histidyl-tRNA synthetase